MTVTDVSTWRNKVGLAEMLRGGVIMDVTTPEQAKMVLRKVPAKPPYAMMKGETIQVKSWEAFLGECYWTVPLEQ